MELLLGSHVREHQNRVGRLAGFELEPATLRVRRLIFSPDGELGPQAMTRSLAAVSLVHDDGELELRPETEAELGAMPSVPDVVLLSRSTRLTRAGREAGRLVGVDVNAAEYAITAVFGRHHWWSRRFSLPAGVVDFSSPGEIRTSNDSRAA